MECPVKWKTPDYPWPHACILVYPHKGKKHLCDCGVEK